MSEPADAPQPEREEEDDYDLLTFGEVAVRLHAEIRALASEITRLEATREDSAELAKARTRLQQLREAVARNSRQPITDENFARFFGYDGKARRNAGKEARA